MFVSNRLLSDENKNIKSLYMSGASSSDSMTPHLKDQFSQTRNDLVDTIRSELQTLHLNTKNNHSSSEQHMLEEVRNSVSQLSTTIRSIDIQSDTFEKLRFPDLRTREVSIDKAHGGTYRWLLHNPDNDPEQSVDSDSILSLKASNHFIEPVQQRGDQDPMADHRRGVPQTEDYRTDTSPIVHGVVPKVPEPGNNERPFETTDHAHSTSKTLQKRSTKSISELNQEQVSRQGWRQSFTRWLRSENGVFYISGKAGSGKSTLMKTIAHDSLTYHLLQAWAADNDKELILVRYFFWNPGSPLQKSITALYRSILWKILHMRPDIIEEIFPSLWQDRHCSMSPPEFDSEILEDAFTKAMANQNLLSKHRLCFFIDGLDEYDGDYWKLAKQLKSWSYSPDVKLCLSSRPYNEFISVFVPSAESWLKLHELTRHDIIRVVRDKFANDERFLEARQTSHEYDKFVTSIVNKADGVFLWVHLVIRSLLTGIGNSCSLPQLQRKLETTLAELNAMFRYMWRKVDKSEQQAGARTFLSLAADPFDYNPSRWVYVQAMIDDLVDNPELRNSILDGNLGPFMGKDECVSKCSSMCRRIVARCHGLLEVVHMGYEFPYCHRIQVLHRTVSDFLSEPETIDEMRNMVGTFNPRHAMALALVAAAKFIPPMNRFMCPGITRGHTKPPIDLFNGERHFTVFDPSLLFHPLIGLDADAEMEGSPPLMAEIEAMGMMITAYALMNDHIAISTAVIGGHAYWHWGGSTPDKFESAIICIAALYGAFGFVKEKISRQGIGCSRAVLLASLASELQYTMSDHQATNQGLDLTRFLLAQGVALNLELPDICLPRLRCFYRKNFSGERYMPSPFWTPWTLFLLRLSQSMIYMQDNDTAIWSERLSLCRARR